MRIIAHRDDKSEKGERNTRERERETLKEELVGGLVGIHGAFLEHCVYLLFAVVARDLLDVLDRLPNAVRD